jgi:hypothetical protein
VLDFEVLPVAMVNAFSIDISSCLLLEWHVPASSLAGIRWQNHKVAGQQGDVQRTCAQDGWAVHRKMVFQGVQQGFRLG